MTKYYKYSWCEVCKYRDLKYTDEPCTDCKLYSNFEKYE